MLSQDVIETLQGYSLKRDYLGDTINYRNIETFTLEIEIIDMANVTQADVAAVIGPNVPRNQLSTYIKTQVAAKLAVDKHNITIRSIEIPNSEDGKEDLIRMAKYLVTVEVRTAVDSATMDLQHEELNPVTDAENKKFHGVKSVLLTYAEEINSISESFDFSDDADGKKSFNHNIDVTLRTGALTPKAAAVDIATQLFNSDVDNEYFGHNVFINSLKNYGLAANNKHYHSESYDLKQNKFSFSKKMTILPTSATALYTSDAKYSLEFSKEGRTSVSETIDMRSRDGDWVHLIASIPALKAASYGNCSSVWVAYTAQLDSAGIFIPGIAGSLSSEPVQRSIVYDEQSLTATISTTFSNDPQITGASFSETIELDKDPRGVIKTNYNVDLTIFDQKEYDNDAKIINAGTGKSALEILKDYDTNASTRIAQIYNFSTLNVNQRGVWWNTQSYLSPGAWGYDGSTSSQYGQNPLSTSITSSNMGKTYSLKKSFSNEAFRSLLPFSEVHSDPFGQAATAGAACANCWNKLEIKWNDAWPKQIVNEHPVIGRGTSPITRNLAGTSVVAPAFQTSPGKRTVTINGVHARPNFNMLTNVTVPWQELKSIAYVAKRVLLKVFTHPNVSDFFQSVGYISNLSYTYDSRRNISLTAELTYTYKGPPV